MKRTTTALFCLAAVLTVAAGLVPTNPAPVIQVAWDASTDPSVVAYKVYQGTNTGDYFTTWQTTNTSLTLSNLTRGVTNYFAATCLALNGLESALSAEISYTAPVPPIPPANMRRVVITVQWSPKAGPAVWSDLTEPVLVAATDPAYFYRTRIFLP